MQDHLTRAAELIEQALDHDIKSATTSGFSSALKEEEQAKAKRAAADRFAKLAQIERGHDVEALKGLVDELKR